MTVKAFFSKVTCLCRWCLPPLISFSATAQHNNIGLLERQLKTAPSPERVVALSKAYQGRANWYREMPHFDRDSTVFYFDKAVALLANTTPLPYERLTEVFRDITNRSNRSHPFVKIDSIAAKGWIYFEEMPASKKDKIVEYEFLSNWASIKIEKGEHKRAIELFTKAFELLKDDTRPEVQAKVLKDQGRFYARYGLPEEKALSFQYMKKSMRMYEALNNPANNDALITIYKLMSSHFDTNTQADQDSSNYYFEKIKKLLPIITNPFHHNWYYTVKGQQQIELKHFDEARKLIFKGRAIADTYKLHNTDTYQFSTAILGDIAIEEGHYDQAIDYYKEARALAVANHFKAYAIGSLEKLSFIYEQKGDYVQALEFHKKWAGETIDFDKEHSERSLRENELQLNVLSQEKELAQKRTERNLFVAAFIIGVLLMGLLYRNYRHKQQTNLQLESLNMTLETKNTQLDKRNAENELLLKEIHHRVKNNLEVVSSLLALQSAQIDDPEVQEAMLASQNRVQSMGILHQKLYQNEHLAFIEMKNYFKNLSENILDSYNQTERITVEYPMEEIELDVDTAVPIGLIVNELLTNALKYAFPKGQLGSIKLSLESIGKDLLQLRIADNGIGKVLNAKAQGTGFGTQLVNLLTRQIEGTLQQEINNGTIISIQFARK